MDHTRKIMLEKVLMRLTYMTGQKKFRENHYESESKEMLFIKKGFIDERSYVKCEMLRVK